MSRTAAAAQRPTASTSARTSWADVRLVAGREVGEKLRSRAFIIATLVLLAIVAAGLLVPTLLGDDGPSDYDVAVVGAPAAALVEAAPGQLVELTARPVDDAAAAERLLETEDVDAAVEVQGDRLVLTALTSVPFDLRDALSSTAQLTSVQAALREAGVPAQEVAGLLAPPEVQERLVDDVGVDREVVTILSAAFALLFFFVVFQFGFAIAQGVVQEKESRIVELLVSAVSIRTLLYGKVLGNGGLALGQLVLIAAVAAAGAAATGEGELLALLARNAGWFLLFFTLGFALLSCLWAAAGAFASRTEDLNSTTAPLQLLMVLPFFAATSVQDGTLQTVLSYVPFSAPLVMPARLLSGDAAAWEGALSAAVLVVSAGLAVLVGERLYRSSLLRTRGRTSLADAWSGRVGAGT